MRALTAPHPIKPTSLRCRSAWQPNLGRGFTYRCGKSVQTTGTTSVSHQGSTFASARDCRRLWEAHRKRLLDRWGVEGRRPQAWWKFDSPIPYPGYARERSTLYEHGLLGEAEARALVADWKVEFERASQPDFFFTAAPGEILQGEAARQKHFDWAHIPSSLLQQWQAARAQTKHA